MIKDILTDEIGQKFDYVFSSGVFLILSYLIQILYSKNAQENV